SSTCAIPWNSISYQGAGGGGQVAGVHRVPGSASALSRVSSRENIPPSALGSCFGLRRISSFVKPEVTAPAVARAVHHEVSLLLAGIRDPGFGIRRFLRVPIPESRVPVASRSTFNDTGGTSTAPGHSWTPLTSL